MLNVQPSVLRSRETSFSPLNATLSRRSRCSTNSVRASSENEGEISRRSGLGLAATVVLPFIGAGDASAVTGAFGLRKSGNGGARRVPESEYKVLPSGVKYYDVTEGGGQIAEKGARVAVHYDCKFKSLTVSTSRVGMGVTGGNPYGFVVGVKAGTPGGPFIEGMSEGVRGMRVGGQRKIIVPPELAYGKAQVQEIPPNATLTFDLELLSIKKETPFGDRKRPGDA